MPKNYVTKYAWCDRGQPFYNSCQITLTDNEAVAFLVIFTVLMAYTQTQVWKLVRQAVKRLTRPIQLPDDNDPDSLDSLTQKQAISSCIRIYRLRRRDPPINQEPAAHTVTGRTSSMRWVSPWFGIAVTVNVLVFIVLGVLLPWLLTSGLESPIVQSRTWDGCLRNDGSRDLSGNADKEAYFAADKYDRCWFNTSGILDSCPPNDSILLDRPDLKVSYNVSCPFAPGACHPDAPPLQLDYVKLTLRDYGVNIDSGLTHSRRLTCAPLRIEHFTTIDADGEPWLTFARLNSSNDKDPAPSLRYPLSWTEDGDEDRTTMEAWINPRLRVRLSSPDGRAPSPTNPIWYYGQEDTAPDFQTWAVRSGPHQDPTIHPDLDLVSGKTFIVAFKAGRVRYMQPINDPMYSAHSRQGGRFYLADYEYTALACVEQNQICHSGSAASSFEPACTPYTSFDVATQEFIPIGTRTSEINHESVKNFHTFWDLFRSCDAGAFVEARGIGSLLPGQPNIQNWFNVQLNPDVQWMLDARAWFESSFLLFRVHLLAMVTGDRAGAHYHADESARDELRGRALPADGDHTNIHLLALVASPLSIIPVAASSHRAYPKEPGETSASHCRAADESPRRRQGKRNGTEDPV
ncbi:hypothetical protein V8F06_007355 [Rhypophila decipiens]